MKRLLPVALFFFAWPNPHSVQAQSIDHWETIVQANQNWKYLVPTSTVPASWNTVSFDDSSWGTGPGGFGYGDGDDATIIPGTMSVYLRKTFTVTDTSKLLQAVLNADYDDAFVAYLNGVEIARANIGTAGTPVPYNQAAAGLREAQVYQGGNYEYYILNKATLRSILTNGTNVLAIQVHNESLSSSDLSSLFYFSAGISDVSTPYSPVPSWFVPPFAFTDSNLPIVSINTSGQTIMDSPRIVVGMGIIDNGPGVRNHLSDPFNNYNGLINIELRGSSSMMFPKKSYSFETQDSLNNSLDTSLVGLPTENDWVLYAPYSEKSLLQNYLTYKLGREMGRYAPRCKYVELVVNGQYQGVYLLMEKIKRDKNRVNIAKLKPTDVSGDNLTGGYILKIDKFTGGADYWASSYPSIPSGAEIDFQYHDPDYIDLVPQQVTYIQDFMNDAETALAGPSYTDPVIGYPAYLDASSFIDFFAINELTRNVDGYRLSTFFYKNKDSKGGKLTMGPLWDFNITMGNANYCDGGLTTGWAYQFNNVCGGDSWQIPFWWDRLLSDSNFANQLQCRWQWLRNNTLNTDSIMQLIDSTVTVLDESQQRNFIQWPIIGTYVWPNNYVGSTYADEVAYLKIWLTDRLTWLDNNMPGNCVHTAGIGEVDETVSFLAFPNPAVNELFIRAGQEFAGADLRLTDAAGQTVISSVYQPGSWVNVAALANGVYNLQLKTRDGKFANRKVMVNH